MAGAGLKTAVAAGVVLALYSGGSHHHGHHGGGGAASLTAAPAGAGSTGPNVALGQQMAAQHGWTGSQWQCLDWLWTRESGWNAYAANPTSDARGIPQNINGWSSYPPGQPAPQIAWGLDYITGRYGNPCAAWAHETQWNWY
jgi:hypothetical protein